MPRRASRHRNASRPTAGPGWAPASHPERHPATYHRTHGVRYFHGCYSIGKDALWGVNRRKKGAVNTLAALGRSGQLGRTGPRST